MGVDVAFMLDVFVITWCLSSPRKLMESSTTFSDCNSRFFLLRKYPNDGRILKKRISLLEVLVLMFFVSDCFIFYSVVVYQTQDGEIHN